MTVEVRQSTPSRKRVMGTRISQQIRQIQAKVSQAPSQEQEASLRKSASNVAMYTDLQGLTRAQLEERHAKYAPM